MERIFVCPDLADEFRDQLGEERALAKEVVVLADGADTAVFEKHHQIALWRVLQLVRRHDDCLPSEQLLQSAQPQKHDDIGHNYMVDGRELAMNLNAVDEYALPDVLVDGAEWVVQQVNVCVAVHGASERDTRLLPAREVDAALADLRQVSCGKELQVRP